MELQKASEIAKAIQLKPNNVYTLAKRGMPHYRTGKHVRFHLPEVLAWMRAQAETKTLSLSVKA